MSVIWSLGFYLLDLAFSLVLYVLWIRIGLRFFRVSWTNLFATTIFNWTDRFVEPFQIIGRLLPRGRYDWAAGFLLLIVEFIKMYGFAFLGYGMLLHPLMSVVLVLGDLVVVPCQLLFYAMIFRVLMSFLPHLALQPIAFVVSAFTQPLINLLGERTAVVAGLDFGPWLWMVALKGLIFVTSASMPMHFG